MGNVKILRASAGSGKTYKLAYEYVCSVIREPFIYKQILAVTFTNKATEEMKQRIVSEINLLAEGMPSPYMSDLMRDTRLDAAKIRERALLARTRILHDYSHFAILTIDKFFQRIIRSFIKELGIDMNFNLELQTDSLLSNAADNLIDEITVDNALKKWILEFVAEKIEDSKKWDVKQELMQLGREVFKESYKMGETPTSKEELCKIVSAVSSKAFAVKGQMQSLAREALKAIAANGLSPEDFPYGRSGFVGYLLKTAEGDITPYGTRVNDALASDEKWYSKTSSARNGIIEIIPRVRSLLEKICTLYDQNIRLMNSAALLRENYRNFALLSDLSLKIKELCAKSNIMPISETNNIIRKLVSGNDTPFIFEKAGNHFSRFMIDEFQDTSAMQWENFIPLLQNALAQSEETPVLLVGDIKQSIYRWRGGDWKILARDIRKTFDLVSEENLSVNYRSKFNVVQFNNNIVEGCVRTDNDLLNKQLSAAHDKGYISAEFRHELEDMLSTAYQNHSQNAKTQADEGYINITQYNNFDRGSDEFVPPVIRRIEELQERGYSPSDIAILVRYNKEGVRIANMLLDYKSRHSESKYSYNVVTQEALTIGFAPVVRFVVAVLKLSTDMSDPVSLAIYNRWRGQKVDHEPTADEAAFFASIESLSPVEAFEKIVIQYALNSHYTDIAYLQALHEQVIAFSTSTIADIHLFVKWWEENGAGQSVNMPQSNSSITIITVHKAKGLQYKAVIIPYCDWSLGPKSNMILWADCTETPFNELSRIPVGFKKDMGESFFSEDYYSELVMSHIDNINIFYVATTRAEEELHIMMPQSARPSMTKISGLITSNIITSGDQARVGSMDGICSVNPYGEIVTEFGRPANVKHDRDEKQTVATKFPSRDAGLKVKLKLQSQRYFAENESNDSFSPRNYGVLMHKVFENADNREAVELAITSMRQSGSIAQAEEAALRTVVARAFAHPLVESWFESKWQTVRNENDIIIPRSNFTRRPDRVMLDGKRAVVVDYKFGLNRENSHKKQIGEYVRLLSEMGYTDIKGYLWYVTLNDIEEVAI